MPNSSMDLVFASDREDIRPISDNNYRTGWNFLGTTTLQTDDHDYVFRMIDEKIKWLYNAVGFDFSNPNIVLPDYGATVAGGSSNNTSFNSIGLNVTGNGNVVVSSGNTAITGNTNTVIASPGVTVGGANNAFIGSPSLLVTNLNNSFIVNSSFNTIGTNQKLAIINSNGASVTSTNGAFIVLADGTTVDSSTAVASVCNAGAVNFDNAQYSSVTCSVASWVADGVRSAVHCSNASAVDGHNNSMVLASQNVMTRKNHTVVLGYGLGTPSEDNINIELDAQTGRVDAKEYYINGSPFNGSYVFDDDQFIVSGSDVSLNMNYIREQIMKPVALANAAALDSAGNGHFSLGSYSSGVVGSSDPVTIISIVYTDNHRTQILQTTGFSSGGSDPTPRMYFRSRLGIAWKAWVEV